MIDGDASDRSPNVWTSLENRTRGISDLVERILGAALDGRPCSTFAVERLPGFSDAKSTVGGVSVIDEVSI